MTDATYETPNLDLRRPGLLVALAALVLVGGLGLWSATAMIGGAVIATGQISVEGKPRTVQSFDGGIVERIAVQSGDRVARGQVLLEFDATLLAVNLEIAQNRLAAALALRARLEAEQRGAQGLVFAYPALPFPRPDATSHEAGQAAIFAVRADVRESQRAQLVEVLQQFEAQATGLQAQIAAIADQIAYLDRDLANLADLNAQGLARQSQISELAREQSRLTGQKAGLEADLSRLANSARDAELNALETEQAFLEQVATELRETTTLAEELILDISNRLAQYERIEVRAPVDGVVHEMEVNTVGAVVAPGAPILQIVPDDGALEFEVSVAPEAIDQVHSGQSGQVVMAAFDRQTTPKLTATVTSVSPDRVTDPQTGLTFYRVALDIPAHEIARLGDVEMVPGMPIEAFLGTGERSVLSYLLNPILAHMRRALRD